MSESTFPDLVRLGSRIVKLSSITSSHWEGDRLFVYLDGGRFFQMDGQDARLLWDAIQRGTFDLRTGEVKEQ